MKYRRFGHTGIDMSALGFGMMRLPLVATGDKVDEAASERMLCDAIAQGLNYVDSAYLYHNGESEIITGNILRRNNLRNKVYLATKAPVVIINSGDDFDRILNDQLKKLQTDHIDFYLLHCLTGKFWKEKVLPFGLLDRMRSAQKAGKVTHLGFSFHDNFAAFKEIIDAVPFWDFCQIQMNYYDTDAQAGLQGLRYAGQKGLGVVIMEPLRGGFLANNVPTEILDIFHDANPEKSHIEWALDFLWDMPEVSVVLSGMGSDQMVRDNVTYAGRSSVGMLTEADKAVIDKVKKRYREFPTVPCTGCGYCMPCPTGIPIPHSFAYYNDVLLGMDKKDRQGMYGLWASMMGAPASKCVACRKCEAKCPQHIKISEELKKVVEMFE
ncbi:aldo/keto reductase [Candidatus Sumerlaeota bacterium]|nr:aldo/keto reductase [Candidatus Sumerlaeales bacterium]NLD61107.1 aldo/keto reductase [Candidatus Sumerlaeota bacterium]